MNIIGMPACCTALIVYDLGGSTVAVGNAWGDNNPTEQEVNDYLKRMELQASSKYAMLVATTNNEQTVANEVLSSRGYIPSPWLSKEQHPETRVRLWYKALLPVGEQP